MWNRRSVDSLELLLHPVRMRVVHAMSGGRTRTTSDLCAQLPDVPKTTLYRHVGLLVDGGVLEVADEQRVHGAVERHYRLRQDRTKVDLDAAKRMTLDDHREAFAGAMAALLAEFNAYLDRDGTIPAADGVGYRQGMLWLDHDELLELVEVLQTAFIARGSNEPAPGRRPYLLSAIFFPTEAPEQGGE